jgi:hypothetical protein
MSADSRKPRVVHPTRTKPKVLRTPIERRRCSGPCAQLGLELAKRFSRDGAPMWLCVSCERRATQQRELE